VFGPDGMLYAASPMNLQTGLGGAVLRFDAAGTFSGVLFEDAGGFGQLNRPEGLVFGPDGNLYVTSFRAAPGDKDGVRIYNPATGAFIRQIDFHDGVTAPRVSAQAILFGPDRNEDGQQDLYATMLQSGEVRAYDVTNDTFTTFIAGGTDLINPFFMTFGQTNPSTLAYEGVAAASLSAGNAVPEPASVVLIGFAVFGLLACARTARTR
jgi:hypothetical protein